MIVAPGRFRVSARSGAAGNQHDLSQEGVMKQTIDEIRRLRGCINDLISVQALPAMWTGQEPAQIVSTLLDVLIGMLRLDFAYARLKDPDGESPIELLRLPQSRNLPASPQDIGHVLQPWLGDDLQKWPLLVRNPIGDGDVSIVPLRLGLRDKIGVIVAGSQRADFPGETERLLLSVAANQAAIGLQEARLLSEQKRVAEELDQRVAQRTSQLLVANEELEKEIAERKRAEEKLRTSQAFLTEAQSISHTGSFGWRVSSEDIFWSEETFRIFQYDRTTKPTVELMLQRTHPDDVAFAKQAIERTSQEEENFDFEHRLLMPDGSIKHVRVVGHAERDELGELEFVGAVMDVTAAKAAEERIRRNERELRTTIETIPALVSSTLPDGSLDFISQSWLDYVGCSKEEILGEGWKPTIHPEDLDSVVNNWQAALAAGEPLEMEARFRRADGKYRWFLVRAAPLRDEKGNIVKWYVTIFDIEDRKQAEEKLRRSEAYLAEGQRLTHTGSWAMNVATGESTHSSEEHCRLFGFDPERGVPSDREYRQTLHREDLDRVVHTYERAVGERTDFEVDYRAALPDGTIKYFHTIGHPVFNAAGDLVEYMGTSMDVTERKRAEEALRASEQVARGQVEALAQNLDILATAPAPQNLIGQMLSTIGRVLNAQSVALWLLDEPNGSLVLRAAAEGENLGAVDSAHPFITNPRSWKNDPWLQEMLMGVPAALEEVEDNPRVPSAVRDYFRSKGTKNFLAIPTLVGGQVKGIISIRHGARPRYRLEEIELAQALAHQATFAVQLNQFAEQSQLAAVLGERNRMARDIHDTLAQGFTGVIVQLEAAEDAISCGHQKRADKHLYRAAGLARQSLSEARRSVHALRPDALERDNLWEALKGIIKSTTAGTALRTTCELRGKLPGLPPIWQENLLHIGQEALTNTLKYAHAQHFRARLICNARGVRLELRDNGAGFEIKDRQDGLGLTGMRERVEQMNGKLEITSARGKGTKVVAALSLTQESKL